MAQVVKHLSRKYKVLSSNHQKKKKRRKERKEINVLFLMTVMERWTQRICPELCKPLDRNGKNPALAASRKWTIARQWAWESVVRRFCWQPHILSPEPSLGPSDTSTHLECDATWSSAWHSPAIDKESFSKDCSWKGTELGHQNISSIGS
jgi:hypothetical protein